MTNSKRNPTSEYCRRRREESLIVSARHAYADPNGHGQAGLRTLLLQNDQRLLTPSPTMRVVLAWLVSALLVLVQGASAGGTALVQPTAKCSRCSCGRACCVTPSSPASTQLPARELNLSSARQLQPALTDQVRILSEASSYAAAAPLPCAPSFRPGVLPIYDWNCSYLL